MMDKKLLKLYAQIELAKREFFFYCNLKAPGFYKPDRHYLNEFCMDLQDFYEGDDEVLVVNMPPRHGKSRTAGLFVEWVLGNNKNEKIMTGSYNETLSTMFSKNVRNSIQETKADKYKATYSDVFPNTRIKQGDGAMNLWSLEGGYNNYLATSPTGTATGFGCFVGETEVITAKGTMTIEELYNDKNYNQVLSFNLKDGTIRYNEIIAKRRLLSDEIVKVRASSGKEITCTADHRFYTREKGWVRADHLRTGNTVIAARHKTDLRKVREDVHTQAVRSEKGNQKRISTHLLFKGMFHSNNKRKSVKGTMQSLWEDHQFKAQILFKRMQKSTRNKNLGKDKVPSVWNSIQSKVTPNRVLFNELQKQVPFKEDARSRQFTLCRWFELSKRFRRYKTTCQRKRRVQMQGVWVFGEASAEQEIWYNDKFKNPSLGRRYKKQFLGKFNNLVPRMPYKVAQDERIISVETVEGSRFVYDIQVDKDENFFADGVLVHNCSLMIIDDLIKNAAEAYNADVLQKHWDWFTNTMLSRLEEGGKIIVIMTRWATGDLAGRVLEHYTAQGAKIKHITLKALQNDGTMLCDEILSHKSYQSKIKAMGLDIASANYQQEPIDVKGRLYTSFKTYKKLPMDENNNLLFTAIRNYTDTADQGDDYHCSIDYGVYNGDAYVLDVIYTKEGMEITEPATAAMLHKDNVNVADIESNNGGRGFGRSVEKILLEKHRSNKTQISPFHQSKNKNSRILSNSTWVMNHVYFPVNWNDRFPEYYTAMTKYQKEGKNAHDDAPDATTGIAEKIGQGNVFSFE